MLRCNYQKYVLHFINPGGTSRGVLHEKETWIVSLFDQSDPAKKSFGECGMFKGLSFDDRPDFQNKLKQVCEELPSKKEKILQELQEWPSIYFGVEMLLKDWENNASHILFETDFTNDNKGIAINGLIWMGTKEYMITQVKQKIKEGFTCLKLKIGAIDFETELGILKFIRKEFNTGNLELRVDANGAFSPAEALQKIDKLSAFDIHSIEQPIKAGQIKVMAEIVSKTSIPVALDEELIGVVDKKKKKELLEWIKPQYIILKPTLVGGFTGCEEWIDLIEKQNGNWWITSALESNIGLNAIAQYTSTKNNSLPQGLGTGKVYSNNFESPLCIQNGALHFHKNSGWNFANLQL